MANHQELLESLRNFEELHNGNEKLKQMNKGWDRVVAIRTTDTGDAFTLTLQGGIVVASEGAPANPQMELISDSEILCNMFFGEIGPSEPFMNGTLKVKGSEDDVLRLDFITAMIWGE